MNIAFIFPQPPLQEIEEEEATDSFIPVTAVKPPKPWVSLGSEQEISNENVYDIRGKVK